MYKIYTKHNIYMGYTEMYICLYGKHLRNYMGK